MPSVGKRGKRRMMNEINVVPYIDVMLVLLVIFMVTAPLIPSGVVDLPSAGKSNVAPDAYAEILVRVGGRYALKTHGAAQSVDRETNRKELDAIVDAVHDSEPKLPFVISGERKVPYEDVISVMNALRERGINRVALMVKSTPG
ncbi:MAG: ExbD/TolR family protein [Betaproteobacteria bacterium]|jgi:biopolymer transport protein TolR|nr:ExbD/TolR family protein [Betaproteobacteria bacterium]